MNRDILKAITRRHHVFLGSSWIYGHCLFTHLRFKNEKNNKQHYVPPAGHGGNAKHDNRDHRGPKETVGGHGDQGVSSRVHSNG
jgi:hypothetical protein